MTSKISFFNIAREDLRRRLWMLALSCLGSFLALPVTFLLANRNYMSYINRMDSELSIPTRIGTYYTTFFQGYATITNGIILTAGAAIVAIWGFRYLYSRKMVDLYHSIPVKRSRLFLVTYLNGLLIWLVPIIIATVVTLLIMLPNMFYYDAAHLFGSVVLMALRQIVISITCFLIFYHFMLVCVKLSGNAFNAIYSCAILGTAVAALYSIFYLLCCFFLDSYVSPVITWNQVLWASPLVSPFLLMADFMETGVLGLFIGTTTGNDTGSMLLRIGSVLVILFNFLVAGKLYLNRPSELAEHGVDNKYIQTLIRLCSSIAAALFGAIIFISILDKEAIGWQLFGVVLCGILVFGVTDIILHMNFKCFFAHKKQMGISILVSGMLLIIVAFDLTGFDRRLPGKENINSARISLSGYNDGTQVYQFSEGGISGVDYNSDYAALYENLNILYPILETLTNEDHQTITGQATSIYINLDTDYGTFKRRYRIYQYDLEVLRTLVESDEYRKLFYPAASGLLPLTQKLSVSSQLNYSEYITTDSDEIQAILDAYTADFLDNYTMERLNTGIQVARLYLNYAYTGNGSNTLRDYDFSIRIYSHFTRTIETLKEYYPELTLEKEDLNVNSLQIIADSRDNLYQLFDLADTEDTASAEEQTSVRTTDDRQSPPAAEEIVYYETAQATAEVIDEIPIEDAEEIQALLPYLQIGDLSYSHFNELNRYEYFGTARLTDGSYVSCYVLSEDLPLKTPQTVKQYLEDNK